MLTNVLRRAAAALAAIAFWAAMPAQAAPAPGQCVSGWDKYFSGPEVVSHSSAVAAPPIEITCNAGNPVFGALAPTTNLTYTFNVPVVNGVGTNPQAFVAIDNPNTVPKSLAPIPGQLANAPFVVCKTPCPVYTGEGTAPPNQLLTFGQNSPAFNATAGANVFPCSAVASTVTCTGIPVVPPGQDGARTFTLGGALVDTSGLNPGANIVVTVTSSDQAVLPVNTTQVVATVQGTSTCNAGALQGSYVASVNSANHGMTFLWNADAKGSFEYTAVTNSSGVVAVAASGTGTYSLNLTNAGCDGTMTLSGLPAPFNKLDVFLKVDTGGMGLAATDPRAGVGSAKPTPREPTVSTPPPSFGIKTADSSCSDAMVGGYHLMQITEPTASLVGKANFDGSGNFTWEGALATSNSTTTSLMTGTGVYAMTGNCFLLMHVGGVPANSPLLADYVALIARGDVDGSSVSMGGISIAGGSAGTVAVISIDPSRF